MTKTNEMIKAIETEYNGYKFRSRLEARWAVFFDTLGVEYKYEPYRFDLDQVGWYIPDFWLPQIETWVEIKPIKPNQQEVTKARELHHQSGNDVVILYGSSFELASCSSSSDIGAVVFPSERMSVVDAKSSALRGPYGVAVSFFQYIVNQILRDAVQKYLRGLDYSVYPTCINSDVVTGWEFRLSGDLSEVLYIARQARFEKGR